MKAQEKPRRKRSSAPSKSDTIVVKQGSIAVKIYVGRNRIYRTNPDTGERELQSEHPQFTLAYYDGSERVRRKFTTEAKAREEAENALIKLANGENEALRLKGADRADYVRAMQKLQDLTASPNLVVAVEDYAAARRRLPADVSLNECVNFYLRRHPAGLPPVTVSDGRSHSSERQAEPIRMKRRDKEVGGFTLIEVMVVVAIVAILVSIGLTSLFKARRTAAEKSCIGNLMQLDSAKQQWAVNENKQVTETPAQTDIIGAELYLKQFPLCPSGGSYSILNVAAKPTCNLAASDGHSLPE